MEPHEWDIVFEKYKRGDISHEEFKRIVEKDDKEFTKELDKISKKGWRVLWVILLVGAIAISAVIYSGIRDYRQKANTWTFVA